MENKKYIGPRIKLRTEDNDVNWNTSSVKHGSFDHIEDYKTNNTEYIEYRVKIRYDDKTEIKPFYFNYICDKCNKPVEEYTGDYVREVISRYMQRNNCSVSSDDILILDARKCHMSYATIYRMIDKPDIINCGHENCEIETKENDTVECKEKVVTMDTTNKNSQIYYTKACLVCGDGVRLTKEEEICLQYGHHIDSKICDKCKQAILHIRKQIETGGESHVS